jgi:hypothetical protein
MTWAWQEGSIPLLGGKLWRPKGGQPYVVHRHDFGVPCYVATRTGDTPRLVTTIPAGDEEDEALALQVAQDLCEADWRERGDG